MTNLPAVQRLALLVFYLPDQLAQLFQSTVHFRTTNTARCVSGGVSYTTYAIQRGCDLWR